MKEYHQIPLPLGNAVQSNTVRFNKMVLPAQTDSGHTSREKRVKRNVTFVTLVFLD